MYLLHETILSGCWKEAYVEKAIVISIYFFVIKTCVHLIESREGFMYLRSSFFGVCACVLGMFESLLSHDYAVIAVVIM